MVNENQETNSKALVPVHCVSCQTVNPERSLECCTLVSIIEYMYHPNIWSDGISMVLQVDYVGVRA
jgi:hypothetical protein